MYYRGAAAAIVVYDITDPESFAKMKDWVQELKRLASSDIVIAIVGNKCDEDENREVSWEGAGRAWEGEECKWGESEWGRAWEEEECEDIWEGL